jgi:hypothetical protein
VGRGAGSGRIEARLRRETRFAQTVWSATGEAGRPRCRTPTAIADDTGRIKSTIWVSLNCTQSAARESVIFHKSIMLEEAQSVAIVESCQLRHSFTKARRGAARTHVITRRRAFKYRSRLLCSSNIHTIISFTSRHALLTIRSSLHVILRRILIFFTHNVCSPVNAFQAGTPQSSSSTFYRRVHTNAHLGCNCN